MTQSAIAPTTDQATPLVLSRVFDASAAQVWKAWTEPGHFQRWWGPRTFTVPVCTMDVRVGGQFLYCMQSPEGARFWATGSYVRVEPTTDLAYTHSFADAEGNVVTASHYQMPGDWPMHVEVAVTFAERDARTTVTVSQTGIPGGVMREMASAGLNESLDRLAESVASD